MCLRLDSEFVSTRSMYVCLSSGHIKQYLLHPHAWVRLAAGRLLGLLLSRLEPAAVASCLTPAAPAPAPAAAVPPYLHTDTGRRLRGLALDLCVQLSSELLGQQLADQVRVDVGGQPQPECGYSVSWESGQQQVVFVGRGWRVQFVLRHFATAVYSCLRRSVEVTLFWF